jgi:hypothetical protein
VAVGLCAAEGMANGPEGIVMSSVVEAAANAMEVISG